MCQKHGNPNCYLFECRNDNAGRVSVDAQGGIGIGIGGGLTINPSDGGLGIQVAPGVSMGLG